MKGVKVALFDNIKRFIWIDPKATQGATIGLDLRKPDGTIATPEEVLGAPAQPPGVGTITVWRFIREIPANIVKLAALAGVGFATRDSVGDWHQREVVAGDALVTVANGDGQLGNPTVGSASIRFDYTAALTWTVNHNLARRVNVGIYTIGGVEVIAEVLHVDDNQVLVTFADPLAGYALID